MGVCKCSHCQVFLKWDGLYCPCCGHRTTRKRKNSLHSDVECSKCGRLSPDAVCTPCRRLKDEEPAPGQCMTCGTAIDVTYGRRYCSSRCREMRYVKECARCGRTYTGSAKRVYCSMACAPNQKGRPRPSRRTNPGLWAIRNCATCGGEFSGKAVKYCSYDCYRRNVAGRCARCGAAFTGIAGKRFCSRECKAEYYLHGAAPGIAG